VRICANGEAIRKLIQFMNYDGGRGEEIMKKNRLNMGKRREEDVLFR